MSARDMTLHFTVHGQGLPLVLFHGWGFDSQIWYNLLPHLSGQYQVHLVDLPGFGLSSTMVWDDFKDDFLKKMPEQFALAGWSMGGLFATRLAIEAPARVTHLLNIASSPRFLQDGDWPGVDPVVLAHFYDDLAKNPENTWRQFTRLQLQKTTLDLRMGEIAGLQAGLDVLRTCDCRPLLSQLQMPVCYLFGRKDTITPRKLMPFMQERYPSFHYVLFPEAAHTPFLSHPQPFIALLNEFLS